ncbi:MAG TPA: glycosyltransferase family 4 protein [Saprospiraceae bacterium]|nr:glycosyltransferase family 4 protein [Saprospiraceae bacterium]
MEASARFYKILVISDYRSVISSRPEAEVFVSLARLGHDVTILSYPDAPYYNERFRTMGIEVIEKHPTHKFSRSYVKYLRALVRQRGFDFVHAFNSRGLVNANWALRGLNTKLIAYRGYAGQTHWYDPMMYLKYFHPRVDHIICLSDDIRMILQRNMLFGKNKLTTIHKGHDPEWYKDVIPADRQAMGLKPDDVLYCFVANVRPFKGLPYLLEATYQLDLSLPIHFLMIGNGYDEPAISKQIDQSPFSSRIHRLGYRLDALSIVAMSDGLILPSTHGEALTKSVIEAMCLGIAPIITDIPGNKGVVIDGKSGWVVPARDASALALAITDSATHPEERRRRGENAKRHIAEHFNTDNTVQEFLNLYSKLK